MNKKEDFALIIDSNDTRREKIISLLKACDAKCMVVESLGELNHQNHNKLDHNFVFIGGQELNDTSAEKNHLTNSSEVNSRITGSPSPLPESTSYQSKYFKQMIGLGKAMTELKTLIDKVARTEVTVMITGESGTGKELCARAIHDLSDRSDNPFVPVNCGAIPDELLESELFGHEKGSFTGAVNTRKGRFEMAQGGTLFLDEIGDMPLNMQVKLLRVLQDKTYERVGGNKSLKSDVRVVTATHKDLDKLVRLGNFREDLFYRLNVFPILVPSLRDRREDISSLLDFYIKKITSIHGGVTFDKSAIRSLVAYDWPGNIRELVNLVDRLTVLYTGETISLSKLPTQYQTISEDIIEGNNATSELNTSSSSQPDKVQHQFDFPDLDEGTMDFKEKIKEVEIAYLQSALERTNWVVAKAAKKLGLQRTTLVEKMKKYGLRKAG